MGLPHLDDFALAPPTEAGEDFLLVFRFEVTRAEYGLPSDAATADLPATGISRAEAQQWCVERGLRLPSRQEWLATWKQGGDVNNAVEQANTLELGLGTALPVGAFESGKSSLGLYDMDGNVWEWLAADPVDARVAKGASSRAEHAGGSFASYRPARGEAATRVCGAEDRFSDVGFRPVVNASVWLRNEVLPRWRNADREERRAMQLSLQRWRAELRTQLARTWRQQAPDEAAFADFLLAEGVSP